MFHSESNARSRNSNSIISHTEQLDINSNSVANSVSSVVRQRLESREEDVTTLPVTNDVNEEEESGGEI